VPRFPLGGVLNLVSKTADAAPELLANVSSRGGRDLEGFLTEKGAGAWSGALSAGAHHQSPEDIDGEGWAELPGYARYSLRPRVWWNGEEGRSLFLTAGVSEESRDGGTLPGRVLPDGMSFPEELHTHRFDGGAVSHWMLDEGLMSTGKLSATSTRLDRIFGAARVASTESNVSVEEALNGGPPGQAWVLGLAFEHDALATDVAGVNYNYNVPGVFAQDEISPTPWLKFAGSARLDQNNEYGTFFSPRASALLHSPQSAWSLRASLGGGYAVPTPFVDEIDATGFGSLRPLRGLHAERATTASLDAKWADEGWDANASVFESEIRSPLQAEIAPDARFELVNAPDARRAPGAEVLIHRVAGPLQIIGAWSYLAATEVITPGLRQDVPLIPRHAAEIGAIYESEGRGRIGAELGYTGRQALYEDPYRNASEPYLQFNVLSELRFRGFSIYLNAINLTNVRQTRFEPLVRATPGPGGNPITDAWAPLDGRTFNLGLKIP
jgi:outer membrane receptor for ferrienterochelin and colicins